VRRSIIDWLEGRSRWSKLGELGQSNLVRSSVLMPPFGYLLLLNDQFHSFLVVKSDSDWLLRYLPSLWRLWPLFYGVVSFLGFGQFRDDARGGDSDKHAQTHAAPCARPGAERIDSPCREISQASRSEIPACALFDVSVGELQVRVHRQTHNRGRVMMLKLGRIAAALTIAAASIPTNAGAADLFVPRGRGPVAYGGGGYYGAGCCAPPPPPPCCQVYAPPPPPCCQVYVPPPPPPPCCVYDGGWGGGYYAGAYGSYSSGGYGGGYYDY
jgi:hypothetical protein